MPDGEEEEEEDDDDDEEEEEEEENRGSEREARWCGGALWWKCILVRQRRKCGSGVARKRFRGAKEPRKKRLGM